MTREEKLKLLLDTGEYDFIKNIPKEKMWKLIFALAYIEDTIPMTDIDGIKAEIQTEISDYEGCADFNEGIRLGLRMALEKIDKHIGEKPKTGHWIDDKCSACGKGIEDLIDSREWYRNEKPNFCPFCGLRLVDSQESEE